jgi:hypothetical protein
LIVLLLVAGKVYAVDDETRVKAKTHYESGKVHYDLGEYQAAVDDYKEAYRLEHVPELLFDIGQAYRMMKRHDEAVNSYHAYLRDAPDSTTKEQARKIIDAYEKEPATAAPAAPATPALAGKVRAIGLKLVAMAGGKQALRVTLKDVHLPGLKGAKVHVRAVIAQGTVELDTPNGTPVAVDGDDVTWPETVYEIDPATVAAKIDPALPARIVVHVVAVTSDKQTRDVARAGMGFTLGKMKPVPAP